MSHGDVVEYSTQMVRPQREQEEKLMGYLYPHAPVEIISAHGLSPVLLKTALEIDGGFESSLQTYTCSLARNIFSQRQNDILQPIDGILFPGNTCDSLQNVADVWRKRFKSDRVFRVTYPASLRRKAAFDFLVNELKNFSGRLANAYDRKLAKSRFGDAVSLWNRFRETSQNLYALRILYPSLLSYTNMTEKVRSFLSAPSKNTLDTLNKLWRKVSEEVDTKVMVPIRKSLVNRNLKPIDSLIDDSRMRILAVGGMVEPPSVAHLFDEADRSDEADIVMDLFSYGFKTVFTPTLKSGDPFSSTAESILASPPEPTQEGLTKRMDLLGQILSKLKIDGLIICEQSFCDPDQFESPSMLRVAKDLDVPVTRLPLDPELSDKSRNQVRIQTLIESIQGGK